MVSKFQNYKYLLLLFSLVLVISTVLYAKFIFGNSFYIYSDVGADVYNAYIPFIGFASDLLRDFTFYSFNIGIGDNIFKITQLFDIFNWPFFIIGKENFMFALVYIAILKHLLTAILFYKFLSMYKFDEDAKIIASLFYAFSAFIVIWGQHYHFASMVVYATLILWMFERWLQSGKFVGFVLSLSFMLMLSVYMTYKFTIFLIFYALFRYLYIYGYKNILSFIVKSSGLYILALLLASVVLLPTISNIFSSPRVSSGYFNINALFQLVPFFMEHFFSSILRFFSSDIVGVGSNFFGLKSIMYYYESPLLYSGLLTLMMIPFLFIYSSIKEKFIYISILFIFILFLYNEFFVSLMTGFNKDYEFRFTYLLSTVLLIGFAHVLTKKKTFNLKILGLITLIYISVILFSLFYGIDYFNWKLELLSYYIAISIVLFFIVYLLYFYFSQKYTTSKNWLYAIIVLEIIIISYPGVNSRGMIEKTVLVKKQNYFDSTMSAIEYIKANDNEKMYRILKNYKVHFNDALMQEFNGLDTYLSINNYSYIEIFKKNEISFIMNFLGFMKFDQSRIGLASLLGTKYFLSKRELNEDYLQFKEKVEDIWIYENRYYVPFGYIKNNYISEDVFSKLNKLNKDTILAKTLVSSSSEISTNLPVFELDEASVLSNYQRADYIYKSFININILEDRLPLYGRFEAINSDPMIITKLEEKWYNDLRVIITIDSEYACGGQIFWKNSTNSYSEGKSKRFQVLKGKHEYIIELGNQKVDGLRIDPVNKKSIFSISDLQLNYLNSEKVDISKIYKPFETLQKNNFNIKTFSDDYITGSISMTEKGYLVFQIPYEKNWKILVNGEYYSGEKVDTGLIGIYLEEGKYNIELKYEPKWFKLGMILSVSGVLILIMLIYYMRIYKKNS